jgi:hypothetical protein
MWILSLLAQQSKERKQCSGLLNDETVTILHGNELLTQEVSYSSGWQVMNNSSVGTGCCEVREIFFPESGMGLSTQA